MADIEQLSIKINSDASSAQSGIESLIGSLTRLKATVAGTSFASTATGIRNIASACNSLSSSAGANLQGLASGIQAIASAGKISITKSNVDNIQRIADAANSMSTTVGDKLTRVANGLSSLASVDKISITKPTATNLQAVIDAAKSVSDSDITKLERLAKALSTLGSVNTSGMKGMANNIRQTSSAVNGLSATNNTARTSFGKLAIGATLGYTAISQIPRGLKYCIQESNDYIESLNLFTVSMGNAAAGAQDFTTTVSDALGIDPAQWMKGQGAINSIISGFGVANDKASIMSKNLTHLAYDISSFQNISVNESFQKIQSGIAGELEPLRRIGYDLSVARLQQEAYNLGIQKSVSSMTQAEKAQLRYYAILSQMKHVQGDMARTIEAPANQLRILQAQFIQCARAIGNVFIPMLSKIIPYAIAVVKVIRLIAEVIARITGAKTKSVDFSDTATNLGVASDSAGGVASGLGKAAGNAKKLKSYLLGIDELNVIDPTSNDAGGAGGGGGGGVGGGLGDDLGLDLLQYDFLKNVSGRFDEIVDKMKEWLGLTEEIDTWAELFDTRAGHILEVVIAIAGAFAAWKISGEIVAVLGAIQKFIDSIGAVTALTGLSMLAGDIYYFVESVKDIASNGADFDNVSMMLANFAGMVGDFAVLTGHIKLGGVLKIVDGLIEIYGAIKKLANGEELDLEDKKRFWIGVADLLIGIGLLFPKSKMAPVGLVLSGVITLVGQLDDVWEAINSGNWDNVDKSALFVGALQVIAGVVLAIKGFSKISNTSKGLKNIVKPLKEIAPATDTVSETTSKLSGSLKGLATNLAWGLVILVEVAAAALIFAGTVLLLGIIFKQVVQAWDPVIKNGETVLIAVGVSALMLMLIGVAVNALGSMGSALALNMALGVAVLAGISVATLLFVGVVWVLGKALEQVGTAWTPVLNNMGTILSAIGLGIVFLVAFGALMAVIGVGISTPAGALLTVAIATGTTFVLGLSVALLAFVAALAAVADALSKDLAPALMRLVLILPILTTNLSIFINFMGVFADKVWEYTKSSTMAGFAATVDTVVGWFTQDPIEKLGNDVEKIGKQSSELNTKLIKTNTDLTESVMALSNYYRLIDRLNNLSGSTSVANIASGMEVNFKPVGKGVVKGIQEGMKDALSNVSSFVKKNITKPIGNALKNDPIKDIKIDVVDSTAEWISKIKTWWSRYSKNYLKAEIAVSLTKKSWSTVAAWVRNSLGGSVSASVALAKSGWSTVVGYVNSHFKDASGNTVAYVTVKLKQGWKGTLEQWLGMKSGGYIAGYNNVLFSKGGYIGRNGSGYFGNIPAYANGTASAGAHGSLFVAGEAGAELVGHINGRSEVLNKSQLASVMHSAVIHGMAQFTGYWNAIYSQMAVCANGIIRSIMVSSNTMQAAYATGGNYQPSFDLAQSVYEDALRYNNGDTEKDMVRAMSTFYNEYVAPTLNSIASDTQKQANKEERTVVQIGNRVITDEVKRQENANGFSFRR